MNTPKPPSKPGALSSFIFASRWLQLPLYIGLILAQGVYVYQFWTELVHLIEAAFGNQHALELLCVFLDVSEQLLGNGGRRGQRRDGCSVL